MSRLTHLGATDGPVRVRALEEHARDRERDRKVVEVCLFLRPAGLFSLLSIFSRQQTLSLQPVHRKRQIEACDSKIAYLESPDAHHRSAHATWDITVALASAVACAEAAASEEGKKRYATRHSTSHGRSYGLPGLQAHSRCKCRARSNTQREHRHRCMQISARSDDVTTQPALGYAPACSASLLHDHSSPRAHSWK